VRRVITALSVAAAFAFAAAPAQATQPLPDECNYAESVNVFSVTGPFYAADGHARVDTYSPSCQSALVRYGLWEYTGYVYFSIDSYGGHENKRYRHV
jgi:hypothetical protein